MTLLTYAITPNSSFFVGKRGLIVVTDLLENYHQIVDALLNGVDPTDLVEPADDFDDAPGTKTYRVVMCTPGPGLSGYVTRKFEVEADDEEDAVCAVAELWDQDIVQVVSVTEL